MAAPALEIRRADSRDTDAIVEILADAFDADPFFRWMFGPDEMAFRRGLRAWLDLVVGLALPRGEGWLSGDRGASIWLPPGTELVGADELASAGRTLGELVGDRAAEVVGAIGAGGTGVPDVPHWLCVYIGVRPDAQGRGLGRALMEPGISASDQDGVPSHLVSTNAATATFYERLGYRVLSVVSAGPGVPALRPMWRDAQRAREYAPFMPNPSASKLPPAVRDVGKVHHVALVVRSIEDALGFWRDSLHLELETVMDIDRDKVRIAFLTVGESKVELVEPTDDSTGVARFLASKGEGFHHVCFEVPSIAETLLRLEIEGLELIDTAPRRGAEGPVAFIHPRACHGVLVELIEAPGGPAWSALGYEVAKKPRAKAR